MAGAALIRGTCNMELYKQVKVGEPAVILSAVTYVRGKTGFWICVGRFTDLRTHIIYSVL